MNRSDDKMNKTKVAHTLLQGDSLEMLKTLPTESVGCCITSPPYYGLRDYGVDGQIGIEQGPQEYCDRLVEVFQEVFRVMKPDATLWLNLGDTYAADCKPGDKVFGNPEFNANRPSRARTKTPARKIPEGLKPKELMGIPWFVANALRGCGFNLRQDLIWAKPNVIPESVRDRCSKSHEYVFLFSKSRHYYFDVEAILEPAVSPGETRRRRSVWTIPVSRYSGAHFATFPPELVRLCLMAGSRPGDLVLDPFNGAGTTGLVALQNERNYVGIDINPEYLQLTEKRFADALAAQDGTAVVNPVSPSFRFSRGVGRWSPMDLPKVARMLRERRKLEEQMGTIVECRSASVLPRPSIRMIRLNAAAHFGSIVHA